MLFAKVFHPDARLCCAVSEGYVTMDVPKYLEIERNRESPAARGDRRRDEILSISMATPSTAHLRVRELFLPRRFTDELVLLRQDGQWRIVAKPRDFDLL